MQKRSFFFFSSSCLKKDSVFHNHFLKQYNAFNECENQLYVSSAVHWIGQLLLWGFTTFNNCKLQNNSLFYTWEHVKIWILTIERDTGGYNRHLVFLKDYIFSRGPAQLPLDSDSMKG